MLLKNNKNLIHFLQVRYLTHTYINRKNVDKIKLSEVLKEKNNLGYENKNQFFRKKNACKIFE